MQEFFERITPIDIQDKHQRQEYSRDKARIIHSASFRRLQGKTQILGLGESDFYRNRLTHSLETAQISNGILEQLLQNNINSKYHEYMPAPQLLDAISLAHDIGHPPFGHSGETALNYCMLKHANKSFEGNAQTLRICTKLGEYSDNDGFNLTRRTLLGLVKYPSVDKKDDKICEFKSNINISHFKPHKFCFYTPEILDWIIKPFSLADQKLFISIHNNKTLYKSFDCSIMEIADDIAYGVHDLEDAIQLGIIDKSKWHEQVIGIYLDNPQIYGIDRDKGMDINKIQLLTDNLFLGQRQRKQCIGQLVHHFISSVQVIKQEKFEHNLLDLQAVLPLHIKNQLDLIKKFILNNEICKFEVTSLNYKGQQMIIKLFDTIISNPKDLLPISDYNKYAEHKDPRIICDYIAGTTDRYLVKIYERIFVPNKGSVFDKL